MSTKPKWRIDSVGKTMEQQKKTLHKAKNEVFCIVFLVKKRENQVKNTLLSWPKFMGKWTSWELRVFETSFVSKSRYSHGKTS